MRISDWSSDVCSSDLKLRDHLVIDETDDEVVGVVDLVFGHIACIDRVDSPGTRMDLGGRGLCTDWRGARDGDAGRLVEGITQGHPDFTKLFESRSEEHTYELQSLMRISYAVFCFKNTKNQNNTKQSINHTH